MRKTVLAVVLALVGTATTLATGVSPAGSLAGCSVAWGSRPKVSSPQFEMYDDPITNVRAGRHACFDRLVVDVAGRVGGYDVRYVPQRDWSEEGSLGPLRGGAFLGIVLRSPGHDRDYRLTYRPANPAEAVNVTGFRTFRQVTWGGTFEGESDLALGVRARLPFRVSRWQTSASNGVFVLDVAHGW